jgi:S-adenosylmethionine synthetase
MSKINRNHIFTSESVSPGHPDKLCDQLSDAVLDACLATDPASRVACESMAAYNMIVNAGEITCAGYDQIDTEKIVRKVVKDIGYDRPELEFWHKSFEYISRLHNQSPDISQGVTEGQGECKAQGAGDQGMMFGYASNETPELMPAPIALSHRILRRLEEARTKKRIPYLRPDAKSQVSVRYSGGIPRSISTVVISQQTDETPADQIRKDLTAEARAELESTGLLTEETRFFINPTGTFVLGGPFADSGLTGRKIIVDTYGGVGSHGGGAFSGKDPSKVDRSAAYYARYAAKNLVASGLAKKCEIQVAYAIGVDQPVSVNLDTYGTGVVSEAKLEEIVKVGGIFDFRPAAIIRELDLTRPEGWSYQDTAAYGHFGRNIFPWEKIDKAEALRHEAGIRSAA